MNKTVKIILTSFVSFVFIIAVTAIILLYIMDKKQNENEALTIEEVVEYSYETPEITTDLADDTFVRIQFQILTDGKKAKEELKQREFQIKNILLKELSMMKEDSLKKNLGDLEKSLKDKLDEVMEEGKVTDVYTINKITQ
ncbi:flagellar basal body-associated protein FliL [Cerasibacillus terrae]|uniref:Flagellar protein FliL n=1 Tax=Cerasibacillus terrae TaxID=2498845 RepID=A0A5C8P2L7_9BACI|nr:flagellar basal body-associated FliL family protein [Cerasibacillus terrae]TXL67688.1 flagellar basal body-associated protein FliL [Cerasibacillus terrae]